MLFNYLIKVQSMGFHLKNLQCLPVAKYIVVEDLVKQNNRTGDHGMEIFLKVSDE